MRRCGVIPVVPLLTLIWSLPCVSASVKWGTTYCLPALCPLQRTCSGRAQSHHYSQGPVLVPPFLSMSNHQSWHAAALALPARVFVIRTFRKNPSNYCSWISQNRAGAPAAEDTWPLPADWNHISDGKDPSVIQGLCRSYQGSWGDPIYPGHCCFKQRSRLCATEMWESKVSSIGSKQEFEILMKFLLSLHQSSSVSQAGFHLSWTIK